MGELDIFRPFTFEFWKGELVDSMRPKSYPSGNAVTKEDQFIDNGKNWEF